MPRVAFALKIQSIMSPEMRQKSFGTFEKRAPDEEGSHSWRLKSYQKILRCFLSETTATKRNSSINHNHLIEELFLHLYTAVYGTEFFPVENQVKQRLAVFCETKRNDE